MSSVSELAQFSFLSCFLVPVPWLLNFLFPFLTKSVLLRKKSLSRILEKTSQLANTQVSFLPFCCSLCQFFKSSLHFSHLPTFLTLFVFISCFSHHFSFLFPSLVFNLFMFLYIFTKHILLSYLLLFLKCCALNYVHFLFCCLLYLSMPSSVCLVLNVLVSHVPFLCGNGLLFVSISSFPVLSHAFSDLSVLFSVFL